MRQSHKTPHSNSKLSSLRHSMKRSALDHVQDSELVYYAESTVELTAPSVSQVQPHGVGSTKDTLPGIERHSSIDSSPKSKKKSTRNDREIEALRTGEFFKKKILSKNNSLFTSQISKDKERREKKI